MPPAMTQISPFASLLSVLISFLVVSKLLIRSMTILVISGGVFFSKAWFAVSSTHVVTVSFLQYDGACPYVGIRGLPKGGSVAPPVVEEDVDARPNTRA